MRSAADPQAQAAAAPLRATAVGGDDPGARSTARLEASCQLLDQQLNQLSSRLHATQRDRDRQAARCQELTAQLSGVLNLLPGGVVMIDAQGKILDANTTALDFLGEPLLGQLWHNVVKRAFRPRSDDGHEVSLADGRRLAIATQPLAGGPGQLVLLTDQTKTRRLQADVSRTERLSAMGKMLAALAHQLRTPLSTAMLYAGQLSGSNLTGSQRDRFGGKLKLSLKHLERQIRDMLLFARGDIAVADVVNTGQLLQLVKDSAGHLELEPGLQCHWHNAAPGLRLPCNPDVLAGAILNLISNAVQAAAGDAVRVAVALQQIGDELLVSVTDNGPGIDDAVLARIEEPFFTTKATGTGLGLAVVRAVAKAHGGDFQLQPNSSGPGVVARLRLPVATGRRSSLQPSLNLDG